MSLQDLHDRGLYYVACDIEASEHYGIKDKGISAWLWRSRCYLLGVLNQSKKSLMKEEDSMQTYILPARWASAIVNNDWTGLDEEDTAVLRKWLDNNRPGSCLSCSESSFFMKTHDAMNESPFAADCLEFVFP